MRAILIDPHDMTITEVAPTDLSYQTMKGFIGDVDIWRTGAGSRVYAYIDDSGLLKRGQRFWQFTGSNVLMAGKALLVSTDKQGEPVSLSPFATLEFTKGVVAFLGDANGAQRAIEAGLVDRPCTTITTFIEGKPTTEVLWTWDHRKCLAQAEGDEKNGL